MDIYVTETHRVQASGGAPLRELWRNARSWMNVRTSNEPWVIVLQYVVSPSNIANVTTVATTASSPRQPPGLPRFRLLPGLPSRRRATSAAPPPPPRQHASTRAGSAPTRRGKRDPE